MERFLKRIHASLYFSNKNWIYIHMCMNVYVLNFGLLDFHSDSLIFIRTLLSEYHSRVPLNTTSAGHTSFVFHDSVCVAV